MSCGRAGLGHDVQLQGIPISMRLGEKASTGAAEFRLESIMRNNRADGHSTAWGKHCPLLISTNPLEIWKFISPPLLPITLHTHQSAQGPWRSLPSPFGNIRLFVLLAKFIQFQLTVLFSIFLSVIISTPAGRCFSNKNLILLDIIILGHFSSGPEMYNFVLFGTVRHHGLFAQWEKGKEKELLSPQIK